MSKSALIKRLSWYQPLEKFHAFVSFPALVMWLSITHPIQDIVFLLYGLTVCIVILYQGQRYWKHLLDRVTGVPVNQIENMTFFSKSKKVNKYLLSFAPVFLLVQLYVHDWNIGSVSLFWWSITANVFAILEYVNYYSIQLTIDNRSDWNYLVRNRKLKEASLAKELRTWEGTRI